MDDLAYRNRAHPGNGTFYQTGKPCIEGCGRPAGTRWSPFWCVECNIARMDRIGAQFEKIAAKLEAARG